MTTAADLADLRAARDRVVGQIAAACARSGRSPADVTLVAVSKTVSSERVQTAFEAGFTRFGENRVQEGEGKSAAVPGATWDLIGPLQSNKAKRAIQAFDTIQTVDSVSLAERLERLAAERGSDHRYPVLLQVNVDRDEAKAGFLPDSLTAAVDTFRRLDLLEIRGLMTVGRLVALPEDARTTFVGLRTLSEQLRRAWPELGPELSMGMTDDYPVAVEEGATIVRVGRAIFGERPHHDDHAEGPAAHEH
ncbi:MAG TPA: YggS family pyridoxal phosphate-dependent enzyme [Candidatus Limnocylindrales bacterium]|nr:YggS family pyridoxal phosphate-dependent enzyme [Candidatus Limnocylindrales bacterium]